jgi:hypothetical protein
VLDHGTTTGTSQLFFTKQSPHKAREEVICRNASLIKLRRDVIKASRPDAFQQVIAASTELPHVYTEPLSLFLLLLSTAQAVGVHLRNGLYHLHRYHQISLRKSERVEYCHGGHVTRRQDRKSTDDSTNHFGVHALYRRRRLVMTTVSFSFSETYNKMIIDVMTA